MAAALVSVAKDLAQHQRRRLPRLPETLNRRTRITNERDQLEHEEWELEIYQVYTDQRPPSGNAKTDSEDRAAHRGITSTSFR